MSEQQLFKLACRAIAAMRKNQSNEYKPHPNVTIVRSHGFPCNDRFSVYWADLLLGILYRPLCGADWQLRFIVHQQEIINWFFDAMAQLEAAA